MTTVDQSPKKVLTLLHPWITMRHMTRNQNHLPLNHDFPVPCDVCYVEYGVIECEHDGIVCGKCHEVRNAIRALKAVVRN